MAQGLRLRPPLRGWLDEVHVEDGAVGTLVLATVRELTDDCDVVFVVGAENSSNSKRLVEVSQRAGTPAHLISDASEIRPEWIAGRTRIGLTAGASAPELLVGQVVDALDGIGTVAVLERSVAQEDVYFKLPPRLRKEQD